MGTEEMLGHTHFSATSDPSMCVHQHAVVSALAAVKTGETQRNERGPRGKTHAFDSDDQTIAELDRRIEQASGLRSGRKSLDESDEMFVVKSHKSRGLVRRFR